jgi:hypothetical protein
MKIKLPPVNMLQRKFLVSLFVLKTVALFGQAPSLDDFLAAVPADDFQSPVADDPAKSVEAPIVVMAPEKVEVSEEIITKNDQPTLVVEAAHTQDAINESVKQMRKLDHLITKIKVGSGEGVVSRGIASYQDFPNRNASLISKRLAYIKAHMDAKKNLAEHFYGLNNEGKASLVESLETYDSENESLVNTSSVNSETINQKVEGLLRGSATYDVNDNQDEKEVEVVIVSTPKTRGETMDVSGGVINAKSAREGLAKVFNELKSGILPPVGGKVISSETSSGNQLYFISFASSIIPSHKNSQIARTLKMNAAKTAQMRAANSLCSLIIGEQAAWESGLSTKTNQESKEFSSVTSEDPANGQNSVSAEPLENVISSFLSTMKKKSEYSFFSKGQLPPGLNATRWISDDGDWSYAAYIYNPGLTLEATQLNEKINQKNILDRGNSLMNKKSKASSSINIKSNDSQKKPNPKGVGKGPSGRVSQDDDL